MKAGAGKDDNSFGQVAVQLGYLSAGQIKECIAIQAKMREMGIDEPLGEIFVKKGYLTVLQKQNVLKKLGVHTSPIPGYTILGKIGQGGMGAVYKANQTSVNRTVAIKILSAAATKDKTYIARFLQEAQAAAALNHKNLISAIDVGEANGIYYFVMEFVTGKSCREILNTKGPFDPKPILDIALQTAEVLDHIHQHNMVHRDIKPENIILTPDGVVKLCDLGLAKSTVEMEQSLTQTGLTVGTPYFMPPEQVRGDRDVDIRADLYSLGGSLYYMASGKYPYEGKSAAETMSLHLNKPVPDVRRVAPRVGEDLSSVIQKLMAKDRANRYQTPAELVEDLRRIRSGSVPQHAREHAARAHLLDKVRSRPRVVVRKSNATLPILAAVGAGAIVLGILIFSGGERVRPPKQPVVRKTPTPPPVTPRIETPRPGPEEPEDDSVKAGEAARLFASAEGLMQQEKWGEARKAFLDLQEQFKGLQYVRERSIKIGENIGVCDTQIREIKEAETKLVAEAKAAAREKRWQDAKNRYDTLVKAGRTEFRRALDQCELELQAVAHLKKIDGAAKKGDWPAVQKEIGAAGAYALTDTGRREKGRLQTLRQKAVTEIETEKFLQHASTAALARKWLELQQHLVALEKNRTTATYKANAKKIQDLQKQLAAGNSAMAERMAEKGWQDALRDYGKLLDERKYDDAGEVMRSFLARYTGTEVYRKRQAEAKIRIGAIRRRKDSDRKDDAKKLLADATVDYNGKRFKSALGKYTRLMNDYSDVSSIRSARNKISGLIADCADRLGIGEHILVNLEFEGDLTPWMPRGGATADNKGPGYMSNRSAKIYFPPGGGNTIRVMHPLQGVTADAETVSFWAKTAKKGPVALINFVISDNDDSFIQEATINNTWREITFRVRDFRPWGNQTTKQRPNLDQIQRFMIGPNGSGEYEFLIDRLRVEKPKTRRR